MIVFSIFWWTFDINGGVSTQPPDWPMIRRSFVHTMRTKPNKTWIPELPRTFIRSSGARHQCERRSRSAKFGVVATFVNTVVALCWSLCLWCTPAANVFSSSFCKSNQNYGKREFILYLFSDTPQPSGWPTSTHASLFLELGSWNKFVGSHKHFPFLYSDNLSMALQPSVGHWPLLQFLDRLHSR